MVIQLLKQYPELAIYWYKDDEHTPQNGGFYRKIQRKRTLKWLFYRYKTYENILKFNF